MLKSWTAKKEVAENARMRGENSQLRIWIVILGGLLITLGMTYLICRLPDPHSLSWKKLLLRAGYDLLISLWINATAMWGIYTVLHRRISAPLRDLFWQTALIAMCFPLLTLLHKKQSIWMILIAVFPFASVATVLKKYCQSQKRKKDFEDISFIALSRVMQSPSLLQHILPFLAASVLAQMSLGSVLLNQHAIGAVLLGISIAIVAWKISTRDALDLGDDQERMRRAQRSRDLVTAALIVLFTCIALLPALENSASVPDLFSFFHLRIWASTHSSPRKKKARNGSTFDQSYAGVVLLTPPKPHAKIVPPSPKNPWLTGGKPTSPFVIPFDGAYWYFRPPYRRPRPDAHVALGNPTKADIYSVNRLPLFMEAHQNLGSHIDLGCCSKIRVELQNADNRVGAIGIEVLLRDTNLPAAWPLSLGIVTIPSSRLQNISINRPPVEETLSFSIPPHPTIHRFDEITVAIHPSYQRTLIGAKISIENFELIP